MYQDTLIIDRGSFAMVQCNGQLCTKSDFSSWGTVEIWFFGITIHIQLTFLALKQIEILLVLYHNQAHSTFQNDLRVGQFVFLIYNHHELMVSIWFLWGSKTFKGILKRNDF